MINTCSPNKGLLHTVVILYYHRKQQAALLSQIYSQGTDRKENTLWTVSNKACIVVPCLVVTQQRSLLPVSKETATVYGVYSCMKNSTETSVKVGAKGSACLLLSRWFLAGLILRPWRWRQYVPLKHWLTFNGLHGVISQKIVLFITTAMITSNPTQLHICLLARCFHFNDLFIYSHHIVTNVASGQVL
jgi:hypothetical protein